VLGSVRVKEAEQGIPADTYKGRTRPRSRVMKRLIFISK
jgi:hypothetical protein